MQTYRLVGGAGTGKTTELLNILAKLDRHGIDDPHQIGFVSFTRAARAEAAARAAVTYGCRPSDLEKHGWFRTIHSVCFQALDRPDGMLGDDEESRRFMSEEVHPQASVATDESVGYQQATPVQVALSIWALARNRLESLESVWRWTNRFAPDTPPWPFVLKYAAKYEAAKNLHGKRDFVDLLSDVAGIRHSPEHGLSQTMERGSVPELPVWFFDEQQDASALLDRVCKRLVRSPATRFVYVVGDPFQAVYAFGGADSRHFLAWQVDAERVMPRSWRCPRPVHEFGERLLRPCRDYWDRGIQPAEHEGELIKHRQIDEVLSMVDPRESWLLLARTHYIARQWQEAMDRSGKPWASTAGGSRWAAPSRNAATLALWTLERQGPITGQDWAEVIKHLPASMLTRGTKTNFDAASVELVELPDLLEVGAKPELIDTISTGRWRSLIPRSDDYLEACAKWGEDTVHEPKVKIGTIHSVKGSEADNVAVLTSSSSRISSASDRDRAIADEERRVAYVAATRARRRLILTNDLKSRFLSPLGY